MPRWITQDTPPVSAISLERCPPSAWNRVRHHSGMLSAITAEQRPGSRGIRTSALAGFQKVPGLLRKYFITTDDGKFGGIYIWKDEASANAWFTPAWRDRVLKEYGQPASLEWFDTPILLPGQDAGGAWVKGGNPS